MSWVLCSSTFWASFSNFNFSSSKILRCLICSISASVSSNIFFLSSSCLIGVWGIIFAAEFKIGWMPVSFLAIEDKLDCSLFWVASLYFEDWLEFLRLLYSSFFCWSLCFLALKMSIVLFFWGDNGLCSSNEYTWVI